MDSLGINLELKFYHWMIKTVADAIPGDGAADGAANSGPPSGWGAVRDLVTEMSAKGVVPSQTTFDLLKKARRRLTSRTTGGDGSAHIADAELEWAFGVLQGIDGAPVPRALPTRTPDRERGRRTASEGDDQQQAPGPAVRSVNSYNTELRELSHSGDGVTATALIARMQEEDGLTPTVHSYASAMNACRNGDKIQWKQALALLREIATAGGGLVPDAHHYKAAIMACVKAKQWGEVGGESCASVTCWWTAV